MTSESPTAVELQGAVPIGSGDLLGALNQAIKDFDMDSWKDQDSSCLLCHAPMSLDFGCDWPDDPRMLLCWSCMSNVCAELLAMLEAPNDGTEAQPVDGKPRKENDV